MGVCKPEMREMMKIQMTPWNPSDKVKLEDLYTKLRIEKHTKKPQRTEKGELVDYHELFEGDVPKRILIKGDPGIGKTTLSKKIVFDWAGNWTASRMEDISLVFLVSLKYISPTEDIEDMIINQHPILTVSGGIEKARLEEILNDKQWGKKCILILEGYDEIPAKYNDKIDKLVERKSHHNCNIIVTARPNVTDEIEEYFSNIACIEGFTKEKTMEYINKVIDDESKRQSAYEYTESSDIKEMWRYPILVLLLCLLVNWGEIDLKRERLLVGEFYDRLLHCVYKRYVAERKKKKALSKSEEEKEREEVLLKIGKIALDGLMSGQAACRKSDIEKQVGQDAFQYGIIIGADEFQGRRFLNENADVFVYFAHKSIQEYLAAKLFVREIHENNKNIIRLIGEHNLEFLQRNLMFLAFSAHFLGEKDYYESRMSEVRTWFKRDSTSKFLKYIKKSLNTRDLTLEGACIYKESSNLLQRVLPKCTKISTLNLKGLEFRIPVTILLKGLGKCLTNLSIDDCNIVGHKSDMNITIAFKKCIDITLKNTVGCTKLLMTCEWPKLRNLVFECNDCSNGEQDMRSICEANKRGLLSTIRNIDLSSNTSMSISSYLNIISGYKWPTVNTLSLPESGLSEQSVSAIGEASRKGRLPSIDLTAEPLWLGHIPVVPVMCGAWAKKESLDLANCDKQGIITTAVANKYGQLPSVRRISLNGNTKTAGQIKILLGCEWPKLRTLDVYQCDLTRDDISAIGEANQQGFLPSIELVEVEPEIGQIPIVPLMCGTWATKDILDISHYDVQDLIALSEANKYGKLSSVREIQLYHVSGNISIVCGHLHELLDCKWPGLCDFRLRGCDSQDIIAIAEANKHGLLPSCHQLDFYSNRNVCGKLSTLLDSPWKALGVINMTNCILTTDDLSAIAVAHSRGFLSRTCIILYHRGGATVRY